MSVIIKSSFTILLAGAFAPSFCPSYVAVEQVRFENPGSSSSGSSEAMPEIPTSTGAPASESDSTGDGAEGGGNSGTSGSTGMEDTTTSTSTMSGEATTSSEGTGEDSCGGDGCGEDTGCSNVGGEGIRYIFVSEKKLPGSLAVDDGSGWSCNKEAEAACLPGDYAIWRSDWDTTGYTGCLDFFDPNCVAAFLWWWYVDLDGSESVWRGPNSFQSNTSFEGVYMVPGDCPEGCVVAEGWDDLVDDDEPLKRPIDRTAKGEAAMGPVWSDVYPDGGYPKNWWGKAILQFNCNRWTSNMGGGGNIGQPSRIDEEWTYGVDNKLTCSSSARVYCYQIGDTP
jgi:hypothetical protein